MSPDEIRDAIATQIGTWATTDIAWPNRDHDPDPDTAWVRWTVKMTPTTEEEKGTGAIGIRGGLLMIQIFVPKNSGSRTGLTYAGQLETKFRRQSLSGVEFGEPHTEEVGTDEDLGQYQINTYVPFTTWIGE